MDKDPKDNKPERIVNIEAILHEIEDAIKAATAGVGSTDFELQMPAEGAEYLGELFELRRKAWGILDSLKKQEGA